MKFVAVAACQCHSQLFFVEERGSSDDCSVTMSPPHRVREDG